MFQLLISLLFSFSIQARTIRIVVLDTGMPKFHTILKLCKNGAKDFTNTDIYDNLGHGSNISGIISDKLIDQDYCMYIFKVYTLTKQNEISGYLSALRYIDKMPEKIDIINFSSSSSDKDDREEILIKKITSKGTKFVVSAGNSGLDLDERCNIYPACYKEVIMVGNLNDNGKRFENVKGGSNYGKIVKHWRNGIDICANSWCFTGTSQSAAVYTSDLALEMCKKK